MKGGNESLFVSLSERERERRVKGKWEPFCLSFSEREREGLKRKGKTEEGKKERWVEWNGNCTLWHGVVKFINIRN